MSQNLPHYKNYLIEFLKEQLVLTKTKGYVLGISGGVDSALLAGLLAEGNIPHFCIFLDCESPKKDQRDARLLAGKLNLKYTEIDLTRIFNETLATISNSELSSMAKANIKPRLRMTTLYAHANNLNYLVLGTDNKCELYLGYFTKFGDGAADILPLAHLNKEEVFMMAKMLNIPQEIIDRQPSASLYEGQTDEHELGIRYSEIDEYLKNPYSSKISESAKLKIKAIHVKTMHKRASIVIPKPFN